MDTLATPAPVLRVALLLAGSLGCVCALEETQWVAVSRCRASCLDTFLPPAHHDVCHTNSDCYICWEMCEQLVTDTVSWGPMCENDNALICPPGCSQSCGFMNTAGGRYQAPSPSFSAFPSQPSVAVVSDTEMDITWETPRYLGDGLHPALVFSLFWRDSNNPDWAHFATTAELSHVTTGPHYLYERLEFKLLAVSTEGVEAEGTPVYPEGLNNYQSYDYESPQLPAYGRPQYSDKQYPDGEYTDQQYYGEDYSDQRYPDAQYPDQQYPDAQYPDQKYPDAQYPDQQYPEAQYPDNQYPDAQYPVAGNAPVGVDPYWRSFLVTLVGSIILSITVLLLVVLLLFNHRRLRQAVVYREAELGRAELGDTEVEEGTGSPQIRESSPRHQTVMVGTTPGWTDV